LAAAYALCRSDAAGALPGVAIAAALVPPLATVGITFTYTLAHVLEKGETATQVSGINQFQLPLGALLLFSTNFVAISFAAALMFLILGYRPSAARKDRKRIQTRGFRASILLLLLISFLLVFTTYELAREQQQLAHIYDVAETQVREIANGELDDLQIKTLENGFLEMELVVRSANSIPYQVVEDLQESIGAILSRDEIVDKIALTMTVILVTELDPLVPPTATPTATASPTPVWTQSPTPLPSATPTLTPNPTDTPTPLPSATATMLPSATPTLTPTMTFTPTPVTAVVTYLYGLNLRAEPSKVGEILDQLAENSVVIILDEQVEADGVFWQQIEVVGMVGWVSSEFLLQN
jgi:hypothetical protein